MKKNPLIGISIILIKKGKILLGLRQGSHGSDSWGMPGGHLAWKEGFFDCAKREAREELGILITCSNEVFFVTNDYFENENKHYVTLFVIAKDYKGKIKNREPDKCKEWRWFDYETLPQNLFLPARNLFTKKREILFQEK